MIRRLMGKASFVHIQDMSGRIQLYIRQEALGEALYENFKKWDTGDIVGAHGVLFKTKTGELSLKVDKIELLAKALRPFPDKFHGLVDQEVCYRQRYLDLVMNEKSRKTFLIRSKVIQKIREYLLGENYLEVETPMMHAIPGGAAARPFATHHNALDIPLFLRIAPELYLKRLVVGGFEKVFEINRNFRNEGVSTRHNPEFTMIEFYQAYSDYNDLMNLTESMLKFVAEQVLGKAEFKYQGQILDFGKPFARLSVVEAIATYNPEISVAELQDEQKARALAKKLEINIEPHHGLGRVQIEIFDKTTEHHLFHPTFITEYPTEISPLARKNDHNPLVTDRFEFFVAGREIANGFSELNDPEDQAERFRTQVAEKDAGDAEAMHYDAEYITALEYGLPPTAGEGIGIDRLVMLLTDSPTIKDVILFPLMKPIT
jgi:lysyl-tRNA synthetase class 2